MAKPEYNYINKNRKLRHTFYKDNPDFFVSHHGSEDAHDD